MMTLCSVNDDTVLHIFNGIMVGMMGYLTPVISGQRRMRVEDDTYLEKPVC